MNIKNIIPVFVLVMVLSACSTTEPKQYADYSDRSGFVVTNPDSLNFESLVTLGKVWGFAKYHHPVFADSIHNIDYELFELLPKVAYVGKEECNAALLDWVRGLGKFRAAEEKYLKEIADNGYILAADVDWIYDTGLLGENLSSLLQNMRYAKRTKPNRYMVFREAGQADFSAESSAGPLSTKDAGYNLLTLFRLWNMAEYYFPSVNITDKKWAGVLEEYVPKFARTENMRWTTAELVAELSDTHSVIPNNPIYSGFWLPISLKFIENKLIVSDNRKFLADDETSLFETGDEIIRIDGRSPDYFVNRARRYIAASNENALLRDAARLATQTSTDRVDVSIRRYGRQMDIHATTITTQKYYERYRDRIKNRTYYKLLNDSIGYMYCAKYKNEDASAIMSKFRDTKAIIVDMRCYPSDFMPFEFVGRYFVSHQTLHVIFTQPAENLPGYYMECTESLGYENYDCYKGQVVVLVNEETQSQAEYTTMAFQACPNTIVVGSQTAGADGDAVKIALPRNIWTFFSGLGVFYPDGTNTQRVGIRIDHYVEPTVEGIRQGRDEVLEKALEIIKSR